ncbi:helix-turn-helix domain-containing protein [Brumimicrobium aurantiacum]|uniref:Helix-turn-helix domain-containing protein n=1 Tax=Brumimicrobium aurantiacum TaxID=1737063 RepID=A0A3E1EXQ3_9FLAO|nr:helix-turn-helix domain-containing protein [Brumimicrobium aurantiacum]RFC54318.1 helix-turn-helix domain-containing protein [Brumimicrobium aurantiacum]
MINREELIRSKEYWLEKIQNELFMEIEEYIKNNNLNKTQFAQKLGVSRSYLTQVLNENFDHKLSKLIELSIAIGKVPNFKFEDIEEFLENDNQKNPTDYSNNTRANVGHLPLLSDKESDYNNSKS